MYKDVCAISKTGTCERPASHNIARGPMGSERAVQELPNSCSERVGLPNAENPPLTGGIPLRSAFTGRARVIEVDSTRDWKSHLGVRRLRLEVDVAPHFPAAPADSSFVQTDKRSYRRSRSGGGFFPALAHLVDECLQADALSRAFRTPIKEGYCRRLSKVRAHGRQER